MPGANRLAEGGCKRVHELEVDRLKEVASHPPHPTTHQSYAGGGTDSSTLIFSGQASRCRARPPPSGRGGVLHVASA